MQRVRRLREPTRQVAERPAEATDQHEQEGQEGQDGGGLERAAVRLVVAALSEIGANLGRART